MLADIRTLTLTTDSVLLTIFVFSKAVLYIFYRLGEKFDLREFHDAVLLESAVPLSVLEEIIHQYINSKK